MMAEDQAAIRGVDRRRRIRKMAMGRLEQTVAGPERQGNIQRNADRSRRATIRVPGSKETPAVIVPAELVVPRTESFSRLQVRSILHCFLKNKLPSTTDAWNPL